MNCETRTRGKLCGREECKHCFERSFASCEKSKYLAEGQENPLLLPRCSTKKLKFDCPKCPHTFETVAYSVSKGGNFCPYCANQKLCSSEECRTCFEKSFASHEKAEFWSFNKNNVVPRQVFPNSHKKYWFECKECGHCFNIGLASVSNGSFCPYCVNQKLCSSEECRACFEKSFASHEKAEFWSTEKNKKIPRELAKYSEKKYWFECPKCVHFFRAGLNKISYGRFCPYCASQKLCSSKECRTCFKKSFASHEKAAFWSTEKNKKIPREVLGSSGKKYWFECGKCQHSFDASLDNAKKGKFCPYCSHKKLCSSEECTICFEKSFASHKRAEFWSTKKNKNVPRDALLCSNKKFWFVCEKKHEFCSFLHNISKHNQWCPLCKNKTEDKLFSFLEEHFKDPIHQFKTSWCKNPETNKFLPFDFCVSKTIIELDGAQHYKQVSNWQSPELTQKNDRYKEEQALKNGYSVLRILQEDVWDDKIDWKGLLLEHIKDYETPVVKNLWEIIKE
nr:restriction endonuclease [Marseillevirus cajuinensis]